MHLILDSWGLYKNIFGSSVPDFGSGPGKVIFWSRCWKLCLQQIKQGSHVFFHRRMTQTHWETGLSTHTHSHRDGTGKGSGSPSKSGNCSLKCRPGSNWVALRGGRETLLRDVNPFTSGLRASVVFSGRDTEAGRPDSSAELVRYFPVALAFHSCMVPIGVPASMRTRTQTVNHLCIF